MDFQSTHLRKRLVSSSSYSYQNNQIYSGSRRMVSFYLLKMNSTVNVTEVDDLLNMTSNSSVGGTTSSTTELTTDMVVLETEEPHFNTSMSDFNGTSDNGLPPNGGQSYVIPHPYTLSYAVPMYGYIMPFLLVLTVVSNTLIVVVLSKRHMRTPTNIVLMSMALSDMFTLLIPAPWSFYMYTLGNFAIPVYPIAACYSYMYMMEVLPNLFHTASIWLTLALAVQRYIYVCLPPYARTWCTIPRVKKGIMYIYLCAILHQSTKFVDFVYEEGEVDIPLYNGTFIINITLPVCYDKLSFWVEMLTTNVYFNFYYGFRIIFVHMIPCTMLVVLNVLLFKAMREAQKKRDRLFKENKKSECKKLRDSNCTTLMLIVVVTVFLFVEIPLAVITLLHTVQSTFHFDMLDYKVANVLILFTNFSIMLSYPINFAIYCGMSRQFRETFKELFIGSGMNAARREGSSRYSMANGPKTCTNETVL